MNIAYSHKFADYDARAAAARQNLEHMMYLFWFDNAPQPMRESVTWQDDTREQIEEWLDDQTNFRLINPLAISDFLSQLVTASHESYKDSHES